MQNKRAFEVNFLAQKAAIFGHTFLATRRRRNKNERGPFLATRERLFENAAHARV